MEDDPERIDNDCHLKHGYDLQVATQERPTKSPAPRVFYYGWGHQKLTRMARHNHDLVEVRLPILQERINRKSQKQNMKISLKILLLLLSVTGGAQNNLKRVPAHLPPLVSVKKTFLGLIALWHAFYGQLSRYGKIFNNSPAQTARPIPENCLPDAPTIC